MPEKRPIEPIAPTTIPGQPLDPKIPPANDDEDDDVGTDENGNETLKAPGEQGASPLVAQQAQQAPDVSSDRVPATDAEPEGSLSKVKAAPLGIQEIENLEDDAKGG